ncbi:sulfur carrier protein ThiS [Mycolicibacterium aubagnense]
MLITVNDESVEIREGTTVAELIDTLGFPDKGIAVAVDWAVVPRSEWDDVLTEGVKIEVVTAVQGG